MHHPVFGTRYSPDVRKNRILIGTVTLAPPAGSLKVRAFGAGVGVLYAAERGPWSGNLYTLARMEYSFQDGVKRGNRLFVGAGLAFEAKRLPFSPQLGASWEHTGPRLEAGKPMNDSRTSALVSHPTLARTYREERFKPSFVVSIPAAQWSGDEGWQRYRIATGIVLSF